MRRFGFHPDALGELIDAAAFYDRQLKGLGPSLIDEARQAITRILEMPEAYPRVRSRTHRCLLKGFPYNLFYTVTPERIRIMAFAHQRRQPFYWLERLKDM